MALQPGKDFAVAMKTTFVFPDGVGHCTAVVTPASLYLFPHDTIGATEKRYYIGGRKPADAIADLLTDPASTPERLEQQLAAWAKAEQGPVVMALTGFQRLRIFTGWLRRSVVFSAKGAGFDMGATGFKPSKAELPAFLEFLKDFPNLEVK